jgi:hypothetical protein
MRETDTTTAHHPVTTGMQGKFQLASGRQGQWRFELYHGDGGLISAAKASIRAPRRLTIPIDH